MLWVELGIPPDDIDVRYRNGVAADFARLVSLHGSLQVTHPDEAVKRTIPVFPYPAVARYKGGDIADKSSYERDPEPLSYSDQTAWLGSVHYRAGSAQWFDAAALQFSSSKQPLTSERPAVR